MKDLMLFEILGEDNLEFIQFKNNDNQTVRNMGDLTKFKDTEKLSVKDELFLLTAIDEKTIE